MAAEDRRNCNGNVSSTESTENGHREHRELQLQEPLERPFAVDVLCGLCVSSVPSVLLLLPLPLLYARLDVRTGLERGAAMYTLVSAITRDGNHTHSSSLAKTSSPRAEKMLEIPSGETSIGCQGKKNRLFVIGAKSATPSPPFVSASKIPCDAVASAR
jgi:hypothetical protein